MDIIGRHWNLRFVRDDELSKVLFTYQLFITQPHA